MSPARHSWNFNGLGCRGSDLRQLEAPIAPRDDEQPSSSKYLEPCPLSSVQTLIHHLPLIDDARISTIAGTAKSSAPAEDPSCVTDVKNEEVGDAGNERSDSNPLVSQALESSKSLLNDENPSIAPPLPSSEEPMDVEESKTSNQLENVSGKGLETGGTKQSTLQENDLTYTAGDATDDVTGPAYPDKSTRPLENSPSTLPDVQGRAALESEVNASVEEARDPRSSSAPERDVNLLGQPPSAAYEEVGNSLTVSLGQKWNDRVASPPFPEQVSDVLELGKVVVPSSSKRATNESNEEIANSSKKRKTQFELRHKSCDNFIKALGSYANKNSDEASVRKTVQELLEESGTPRVPIANSGPPLDKNNETGSPGVEPPSTKSKVPPSGNFPSAEKKDSFPVNRVFTLIKLKEPLPRGVRLIQILKTDEVVTLMEDMWKRWCNNIHCDDQFQSLLDDSEVLSELGPKFDMIKVQENILLECYSVWPLATEPVAILHDVLDVHLENNSDLNSPSRKVTNARLILSRFLFYTKRLALQIRQCIESYEDDEEGKEKRSAVIGKVTAVEQRMASEAQKCGKPIVLQSLKLVRTIALTLEEEDSQGKTGWKDLRESCVDVYRKLKELKAPVPTKKGNATLTSVQKQKSKVSRTVPGTMDVSASVDALRIPKKPISADVPNLASRSAGESSKAGVPKAVKSIAASQPTTAIARHENGPNFVSSTNPRSNSKSWIPKEPDHSILSTRKHGNKGSGRKKIHWKPGRTDPAVVKTFDSKEQSMKRPVLDTLFRDMGSGQSTLLQPQTKSQTDAVEERLQRLTLGGVYKLYGILYSNATRVTNHYASYANGQAPASRSTSEGVPVPNFNTVMNRFGSQQNEHVPEPTGH